MVEHTPDSETIVETAETYDLRHGFNVGFLQLLLQAQTRAELIKIGHLCSIPDTPDWFAGFINHRGDAVPVFDLAACLGLEPVTYSKGWLLLLDEQPTVAGLLLAEPPQGVTDPVLLDEHERQPELNLLQGISSGQYRHQNGVWFELDHRAFFMAQKQRFNDINAQPPV